MRQACHSSMQHHRYLPLFSRVLLCIVLSLSLAFPSLSAFADTTSSDAAAPSEALAALESGSYVEHEAIAYVIDERAAIFSFGSSLVDGAESLMAIDAQAAKESLGKEESTEASASAFSTRSLSASDTSRGANGRLVLVRNESKTTAEIIAELKTDPRVAFAEPNALIRNVDDEQTQRAAEVTADLLADAATETTTQPSLDSAASPDGSTTAVTTPISSITADDSTANTPGTGEGTGASIAENIVFGSDTNAAAPDLNRFVWGFSNDGSMGGISAQNAIDMGYAGWDNSAAASDLNKVIVAVIDNGVDETNPDLAPVLWDGSSFPELKTTGKEDDHGFAAAANHEQNITSTTGISNFHGTHVAGTVGAAWNGSGISGLAPNAQIMSARHNDTLAGMLGCLDYVKRACEAGVDVKVTNNSWVLGQGLYRSVDLAVTAIGQQGVTSIFSSGNSAFDNDAANSTATTMAENPYVVVVNSLDPTGAMSNFSQYGATTTDVMAPGSGILSTYSAADPCYLAEGDNDATLYQSFDSRSHATTGLDANALTFDEGQSVTNSKSFDGDGALALPFSSTDTYKMVTSQNNALDLSGLAEKPSYLSMRYTTDGLTTLGIASAVVMVKTTEIDPASGQAKWYTPARSGSFGIGGDSWGGFYGAIPENTDWQNFQIRILYAVNGLSMVGGVTQTGSPIDGTMIVDSIGFGSELVPYTYMQGTSMASPAVAGAATVLAGSDSVSVADDTTTKADKAARLAALVKGASIPTADYANLCSTGGYSTVDGATDPGPAITEVENNDDSVTVRGYFLAGASTVKLGDASAPILSSTDTELQVEKPAGFIGGQTTITVTNGNGKQAKHRADLGARTDVDYYDTVDLPLPSEVDTWSAWSLVGFDSNLYCLPSTSIYGYTETDHILRYLPERQTWEQVPLPAELMSSHGLTTNPVDVSGTTIDGALLMQMFDESGHTMFARYTTEDTWEALDFTFTGATDENRPFAATLTGDGENAYLIGGVAKETSGTTTTNGTSKSIRRIDFDQKQLIKVGELVEGTVKPQVSYHDGSFLVSSGSSSTYQMGGVSGAQLVSPATLSTDPSTRNADTTFTTTRLDFSSLTKQTGQLAYASGALKDGFMLAGAESNDGTADTYLLSEGATAPTAYGKRASWQALLTPSATAYRGSFYVLAGSQNAPYRVFSATAAETVDQPGDATDTPNPPIPTPTPDPGTTDTTSDAQTTSDASATMLAKTGDATLPTVPLAVALGAAVTLAAATAIRRYRRD